MGIVNIGNFLKIRVPIEAKELELFAPAPSRQYWSCALYGKKNGLITESSTACVLADNNSKQKNR